MSDKYLTVRVLMETSDSSDGGGPAPRFSVVIAEVRPLLIGTREVVLAVLARESSEAAARNRAVNLLRRWATDLEVEKKP